MSADLFEAFGQTNDSSRSNGSDQRRPSPTNMSPSGPNFDFSQPPPSLTQSTPAPSRTTKIESIFRPGDHGGNDILFDAAAEQPDGIDDDFGEFEDVDDTQPSPKMSKSPKSAISTGAEPFTLPTTSQNSRGNNEAPLLDLLSLDVAPPPSQLQSTNARNAAALNLNLSFFDTSNQHPEPRRASDVKPQVDQDEGWGDFEAFESSPAPQAPPARSAHQSKALPTSPLKQSTVSRIPPSKPSKASPSPDPLKPTPSDFEDWDAFDDGPSQRSLPVQSSPSISTNLPIQPSSSLPPPSELQRPTNIPPPAILLSLLPTTIQSLVTLILTQHHSPSSDPHTNKLPSLIQAHHTLTSRLTSTPSRLLRWRRDTLLAQSTRISLASRSTSNAGSGGMKLSSVNKGESIREERETAEAVEVWNRNVHHFSRVLGSAKSKVHVQGQIVAAGSSSRGLKVSMNMPVKVLTGPGLIQSALVCPVCGLKRSERLGGADDVGVEDVFGEYWLENWGHRDCAEWWYRWKGELSQR